MNVQLQKISKTSTTVGIGNFRWVGGLRPRKRWRGGGLDGQFPPIQYGFKYPSSCSKILPYLIGRAFTCENYLHMNHIFEIKFSFFEKQFGS